MGKLTFSSVFGLLGVWIFLCFCAALCIACEDDGSVVIERDTLIDSGYDVQDIVADDVFPESDQPDVVDANTEPGVPCVIDLSDLTLVQVNDLIYNKEYPIVVYLYFIGCPWCVRYEPVFEEACRERSGQGVVFYKINIHKVAVSFMSGAYPSTHFFFNNDQQLFYELGYMEEDELLWYVDKFLRDISWKDAG